LAYVHGGKTELLPACREELVIIDDDGESAHFHYMPIMDTALTVGSHIDMMFAH
jgi:hypothetical protein